MLSLILSLFLMVPLSQSDWTSIVKPAMKMVPRLEIVSKEGEEGICSGVVINKSDGYVLTAAHCVDGKEIDFTVDDRHGEVKKINRKIDLAIVKTNVKGDQMTIAPRSPEAGAEVAVIGYAFGVSKLAVQFGRVSQSYNEETKTIWLDASVIPGNSGGAIIDSQGRLVGLTSRIYFSGPSVMGAAIPVEQIEDFVDDYLPGKVKK